MKKKSLLALMVITLSIICAISVSAATEGIYTYSVSNGEAKITKCSTSAIGDIVIPDTLGGYLVTSIGDKAFYKCSSLKSVTIPDIVISIGDYAFFYCRKLASITIPKSVTTIGDSAFQGCDSLVSITIPENVTTIGDRAFERCSSLVSITIPKSVTTIGPWAFQSCDSLVSITIPENVTTIGNCAFAGCDSLVSITIPENVTTIGDSAFQACVKLANITIPENVTTIGDHAFAGCSSLVSITIPKSVTTINSHTFVGCSGLVSITIPENVTTIGYCAFYNCSSLVNITIPEGVTSIGDEAFSHCSSLTSVTIPEGVITIDSWAFESCHSLVSVTIPKSVTTIGWGAFTSCYNIKNVYFTGSQSKWKSINIGTDNECLTNAKIHYGSSDPKDFVLSATNITANSGICKNIYVYDADGVTPYDKSFKVTTNNPSVVLPIISGNAIVLNCISSGSATITVSATDGSGIKKVCAVNVTNLQESYLLERFALSRLVYSNLTTDIKVGDLSLKANKKPMFYLSLVTGETKSWGDFLKQYINDYNIVMLPRKPMEDGFYAAAFENPISGDIIIAYRGTQADTWEDLWTDAAMVLGILNKQFDQAIQFYNDVEKEYPDRDITLTGHSLGGALASYVAINRQVKCDNVNGATDWLFGCNVLDTNNKYFVDYEGYDKYVFEHINDSFFTFNSAITKFVNMNKINHSLYADTQNYNSKSETIAHINGKDQVVGEILKKDHHNLSSIINYSDGVFTLTEKTKEHITDTAIEGDELYLGTSKDDVYTRFLQAKSPGRNPRQGVQKSKFVISGDGNDSITLPGSSDDTLIGNAGNDTLNGGAGNDTYVYGGNFGHDTIIDPSGNDKIVFTDVSLSDLAISGNVITCGLNSITISDKSKRTKALTIEDKNKLTTTISFANASMFSLRAIDVNATKNVQVFGNATVEIYNADEELIDTLTVNEETETAVEYKDYGMVAFSAQAVNLTLPPEGYIVKVKSEEIVSVWAVSDADNPTVAKQTFANEMDLSNGSVIVINTGEMVEEQLSVKLVSGTDEEIIYTPTPESFVITANKTEIKTGEAITMSVPEFYATAAQWECSNRNVAITKNEDFSVRITGFTAGEETIRAYLPNDGLYSAEFSFEITEEAAPTVTVTSKDESYDGTAIATDSVVFDVVISEGYDTIVFDTQSSYSQIEDTNTFVINEAGEHTVNIYCRNSQTGARTNVFAFEFALDNEAPEVIGIKDEAIYYTDRIIEVSDYDINSIYINGELCEENSFILSEAGEYTVTATDTAGSTTSVSFEIKTMLTATDVRRSDAQTISQIRNDFEEVKYLLSSQRMDLLENEISSLEETLVTLLEVLGDIDKDGCVTVIDVLLTLKVSLNSAYDYNADFNEDGKITLIDVLRMLKLCSGA